MIGLLQIMTQPGSETSAEEVGPWPCLLEEKVVVMVERRRLDENKVIHLHK